LDRRLLSKEINGESFRRISSNFGYSATALRRHLADHLAVDLAAVRQAREDAKAQALAAEHAKEIEVIKSDMANSTAARLENAASFFDQLREVRRKAATLLDQAEATQDLRAAGTLLKELREQIRLMAELEGKLASQPQINILINPQWIELRTQIITALEPFPQAKEAILRAIRE